MEQLILLNSLTPVSYTHLDVYKRQISDQAEVNHMLMIYILKKTIYIYQDTMEIRKMVSVIPWQRLFS